MVGSHLAKLLSESVRLRCRSGKAIKILMEKSRSFEIISGQSTVIVQRPIFCDQKSRSKRADLWESSIRVSILPIE